MQTNQTQPGGPKRASIQDVINQVKNTTETKLWRLDTMQLEDGSEVQVYVGRVATRDGVRTFPAIVLRLVRNGSIVRDYVVSTTVASYLMDYLAFANEKKMDALRQFVNAFKISNRIVNAEEGGEL